MNKLFLFIFLSMMLPQMGQCIYYFGANVSNFDPCCIHIEAGATGEHDNDSWWVQIDGQVYDYNTYGNEFDYCVNENSTNTITFHVVGDDDPYWTEVVTITGCNESCCDAPNIGDISVLPNDNGAVIACMPIRENCPDLLTRYRYRELGTGAWTYTNPGDNCELLGVDPCTTYEIQVKYLSPDCESMDYSESSEFTTEGDCLNDDCTPEERYTITPTNRCGILSICLNLDNYPVTKFAVEDLSNGNLYTGNNNHCITTDELPIDELFKFRILVEIEDCERIIVFEEQTFMVSREGCRRTQFSSDGARNSQSKQLLNNSSSALNITEDNERESQIYPNPFTNSFNISFISDKVDTYQITLMNTQGKIIKTQEGKIERGINTIKMNDLGEYSAGIYFYQCVWGDQIETGIVNKY